MIDPDTPCAACGCRYGDHCGVCGCQTRVGEIDECLCAKFVAVIHACPHCGHMFGMKWMLQNHLMPVPTCSTGARAAAGRHAEKPHTGPPLRDHRDKYVRYA